MKNAHDPAGFEMPDQILAVFHGRKQEIIHVESLLAGVRDEWGSDAILQAPFLQVHVVVLPHSFSMCLDVIALFKLCKQVCCKNVRRQVRGS